MKVIPETRRVLNIYVCIIVLNNIIIIKPTLNRPQVYVIVDDFSYPAYVFLFSNSQRLLNYLVLQCFHYDIFAFDIIIWLSYTLSLSIPNEYYSRKASCRLH